MIGWTDLYAVRIDCLGELLRLKVLKAEINSFRTQAKDYFSATSLYKNSDNLQYHVSRNFSDDFFTGRDSKGRERKLLFTRLICLKETKDGNSEEA